MTKRITISALALALALAGCAQIQALLPASATPAPIPTSGPLATVALPPAYTPTDAPTPRATLEATPQAVELDQGAALLPAFQADAEAFPQATRYWIEVSVTFDETGARAALSGNARIRYTNTSDKALRELVLMLWPNDPQYAASMSAGPVLVDGQRVEPTPERDGRALRLRLPIQLISGATVELSLPFEIETETIEGSDPKRFGITRGVLLAPTFYPLIPRLVDGRFEVEVPAPGGDTTNSDIAFYQMQVRVPSEYDLVATGVQVDRQEGDSWDAYTYVSGPVRDVALAVGVFENESRQVGDVFVNAWVLLDHLDDIDTVLDAAAAQLAILNEKVGPYPYTELDVVDGPGAFGGIEYPGLVFIGTLGSPWIIEPTVHEVAHQWFYGLIGDDQLHDPWLDEAAATWAEALYYEEEEGPGRATGFLSNIRAVVRAHSDPDQPIGLGVGDYDTEDDYALFVYYKGALFFDALRRELGDETFFTFLREYYAENRYGFAEAEDFQGAAELACGCDLSDLFDLWVYEGGPIAELQ